MVVRSVQTLLVSVVAAGCLIAGVSGCSGGAPQTPMRHATGAGAPSTASPAASSVPTSSGPATSGPATSSVPSTSEPASVPRGGSAPGRCAAADLRGSVDQTLSGQQRVEPFLVLQNTGSSSCTLQGWPGVSFVGGGTGTQIGVPANAERSSAHSTVTLTPGGDAYVSTVILFASSVPAEQCKPAQADGFRVFPPGSRASLFIKYPLTVCSGTATNIMTVFAVSGSKTFGGA